MGTNLFRSLGNLKDQSRTPLVGFTVTSFTRWKTHISPLAVVFWRSQIREHNPRIKVEEELVLLSPSWTEPDRTGPMGSVQSDLKIFQVAVRFDLKISSCSPVQLENFQVAVQSDLNISSCSPVRLENFKLMGLMGLMGLMVKLPVKKFLKL